MTQPDKLTREEIIIWMQESPLPIKEMEMRARIGRELLDALSNKHPETDFVCEGVRQYGKVIDTPFPELPEVYSAQK